MTTAMLARATGPGDLCAGCKRAARTIGGDPIRKVRLDRCADPACRSGECCDPAQACPVCDQPLGDQVAHETKGVSP